MPDQPYTHDDKDADRPKGGHPGPTDKGREGGMAMREKAPELTEDPPASTE